MGWVKKPIWIIRRRWDKLFFKRNRDKGAVYEPIWANRFHDTLNDKDYLKNLALNLNVYACNYSLLYLMVSIIFEYKISRIIEFGLGESSKLLSTMAAHNEFITSHTIIEHNQEWIDVFNERFHLSDKTKVIHLPAFDRKKDGFKFLGYQSIGEKITDAYELYIIDGPLGARPFSRIDILDLAKSFTADSQFVIILDDYNRLGEYNTGKMLMKILQNKQISFNYATYSGFKSQLIIATEKYKYATTA